MMKVISEFLNMPKREVIDCRATSLRDIFSFYGIDFDSYTLLLLGNAFGFILSEFSVEKISGLTIWTITNSLNAFEDNLLDNIALAAQRYIFSNDDNGWASITGFVDQGIPLLVNFDARYIKPDAELKNSSEFYLNMHHGSLAVLVGYDAEKGCVFLDMKPEDYYVGLVTVERNRFMFARNSQCYPAQTRNRCLELYITQDYSNWLKRNLKGIIEQTLSYTCKYMLNGEFKDKTSTNCDPQTQQIGIHAIRALGKKLESFGDELTDSAIDPGLADRLFVIVFTALRSGIYQGSNTLYREEFGKGLKKVAPLLKNAALHELGTRFEESSFLMRDLVRKLSNVNHHVHSKAQYINALAKTLTTIADNEEELFEQLLRVINSK